MKNTYRVEVTAVGNHWFCENGSVLHRIEGPAFESNAGYNAWWNNGKRHREDGPARTSGNGAKQWWLNNKQYTECEHKAEMQKRSSTCNGKIVQIDGKSYTLTEVK